MTGCDLIRVIAKFGFIAKGLIDTPLDRVRGCVRKQYLVENPFPPISTKSSHEEIKKWNELHQILNKVTIYPL